jgi:hypothetical protein
VSNNLTYRTHDPASFSPLVEEIVRKDVGASAPLRYGWKSTAAGGSFVGDIGRIIAGTGLETVAILDFDLPWQRPARLTAVASRTGAAVVVGVLHFEIELDRDPGGGIEFDERRGFVAVDGGASPAASRLNASKDLTKRLKKLLRKETMFGTLTLRSPSRLVVEVADRHGTLHIDTLARTTGLLQTSATTDAGEVLEVASAVDRML